jgi:hypothetical protein
VAVARSGRVAAPRSRHAAGTGRPSAAETERAAAAAGFWECGGVRRCSGRAAAVVWWCRGDLVVR